MKRLSGALIILLLIIISSCKVSLNYPHLNLVPKATLQKEIPTRIQAKKPDREEKNNVKDSAIIHVVSEEQTNTKPNKKMETMMPPIEQMSIKTNPEDSTKKIEAWGLGAFAASVAVFCLPHPFSNGYSYVLAALALGLALLSLRKFNRNPEKYKYRFFSTIAMIIGLALTTFLLLMLLQTLISGAL